jgi:hypothetical protein
MFIQVWIFFAFRKRLKKVLEKNLVFFILKLVSIEKKEEDERQSRKNGIIFLKEKKGELTFLFRKEKRKWSLTFRIRSLKDLKFDSSLMVLNYTVDFAKTKMLKKISYKVYSNFEH